VCVCVCVFVSVCVVCISVCVFASLSLSPSLSLQVVHGTAEAVTSLCKHPDVAAISFVGSSKVGKIVTDLCNASNKRILALGGAKNHLIAVPDCDVGMAARDVVASFAGCAGQRCMAASVLVLVDEGEEGGNRVCNELLDSVVKLSGALMPGQKAGEVCVCGSWLCWLRKLDVL
jgi:malonate-semialdehyde dehydrogenase (acetylating) / methylmalonate-semialdehyde dehydrogenase